MATTAALRTRVGLMGRIRPLGSRPALVNPPAATLEDSVLAAADRLDRGWGASCPACEGQMAANRRCGSCGAELA